MNLIGVYAKAHRQPRRAKIIGTGHFTAAALAIILSSVILSACGPSFESYRDLVRRKSAGNSEECGIVTLRASRAEAIKCAQLSLSQRRPVNVIFQVQGVDSRIFHGLAVDGSGNAVLLQWDSDVKGGSGFYPTSQLGELTCPKPNVADDYLPISCN